MLTCKLFVFLFTIKGVFFSSQDIIENHEISLDLMFKTSLLFDLAKVKLFANNSYK